MNIRRRSLTDSLQLLVDTICNLFGSIVIISLLMALLSKDAAPDATAGQSADIQRQIQQTQTDLEETRRFQSTILPNAEDTQRLALADKIAELKTLVSSNLALVQSNTAPATSTTAVADIPVEDLLASKTALETQLAALTNQLDRVRQANTRQLRLPRERATGKKTYYVICRFGKIYPVHIFREGQRERNNHTITWDQAPYGGSTATPRRELGLDPATSLAGFASIFTDLAAQTYAVHFLVYPDSFPAFLAARQIPLNRNYDTGWEFYTEDRTVVFSSRGSAPPAL
jgi:hypothetical protein